MMSKKIFFTIAAALIIASLPLTASADDFDGSMPLTCASIFSAECGAADQECITGAPWMINFPVFMEVDFKAKTVSTTKLHENPRTSKINHVSKLNDGHTAIQGIDDDFVWSMLIAEETGSMTLSISGEDTGYIVFGACHPD
jgi:hypothetical protein